VGVVNEQKTKEMLGITVIWETGYFFITVSVCL